MFCFFLSSSRSVCLYPCRSLVVFCDHVVMVASFFVLSSLCECVFEVRLVSIEFVCIVCVPL